MIIMNLSIGLNVQTVLLFGFYQVNDGVSDCVNGEDEGFNPDTDNDEILNNLDLCPETEEDAEVDNDGCAASQRDSDSGLTDAEENNLGTNPNDADTDGDGTNDTFDTFPLDSIEWVDSDGDGISSRSEY